jgi:hypothetical protein
VCLALVTLLLVVGLRPAGVAARFGGPLPKRWSQELRTLQAPVHPGFFPAACRDRGNTGVFLECLGSGVTLPWFAKGHKEAGGKARPSPWQSVKQGKVGMALGVVRDRVVEVGHGRQGDAELGHEGLHQEGVGGDNSCIRGQCHRALAGLEARLADVGRAPVVCMAKVLQGGATREWRRFESRPAAQEGAQDARIFLLKPLQNGWAGVFKHTGQAIGAPDLVADQATAVCDEWRSGAPRGALGGQRGERVAVFEEAFDLELGIGGVVFGPAGGQRFTVLRQGARMDGEAHEEIIWAQGGDNGPVIQLKTPSNGLSVEPRAQGLDPRVDRFRAVLEHQQLSSLRASGL